MPERHRLLLAAALYDGRWERLPGGGGTVPFTGTFRLPFVFGDSPPLYLIDPAAFTVVPVEANEYSLGYPTVRFEINF